jgi:hypothetical protein
MSVYEKLGVRILQRAWFNFDLARANRTDRFGVRDGSGLTTRIQVR